mmetsp:Transcript_31448/g.121703  ORF Transcript_31448/g.121703 Transcript_31448/m.121703 type:complete len:87 (+) Transcript_31448:3482-3742(+)
MDTFTKVYPPEEDTFLLIDALLADKDRLLALQPGGLAVEIGCGSGEVTSELIKLLGKNLYVLSTDVNPIALAQCQNLNIVQVSTGR